MKVYIDFETYSEECISVGTYNYANHPSTKIMLLCYKIDDQPVKCIDFVRGSGNCPDDLANHIVFGAKIVAHNYEFEKSIWKALLNDTFPPVELEQWSCTMIRALAMGYPAGLNNLARSLSLNVKKNKSVMTMLSKPVNIRTKITEESLSTDILKAHWSVENVNTLIEYCIQDVNITYQVDAKIRYLDANTRRGFVTNDNLNSFGFKIDTKLVKKCIDIVNHREIEVFNSINAIFDSQGFTPVENPKNAYKQVKDRINSVLKDSGCNPVNSLSALSRELMIKNKDDFPKEIIDIIELIHSVSSATSKYTRMLKDCNPIDDRVRHNFIFMGAFTGRWTGRGVQPQNLPRGSFSSDEQRRTVVEDVLKLSVNDFCTKYHTRTIEHIASCTRSAIIPEKGNIFFQADFSSIEAVYLTWLVGGDLSVFEGDVYKDMASTIFGVTYAGVTSDMRSIGKTTVLSLGYRMGVVRFTDRLKEVLHFNTDTKKLLFELFIPLWIERCGAEIVPIIEDIFLDDCGTQPLLDYVEKADKGDFSYYWDCLELIASKDPVNFFIAEYIIHSYRKKYYMIKQFWIDIESSFRICCQGVKEVPITNNMKFINDGYNNIDMVLPSGRKLHYSQARELKKERYGNKILAFNVAQDATGAIVYNSTDIHGGVLTNHAVQAGALDLMQHCVNLIDKDTRFNTALIVHDEVVCEVNEDDVLCFGDFLDLMSSKPKWAEGLPLKCEGWINDRYKK